MMNAARRLRQKANHIHAGQHSVADHEREPDPDHPGRTRNVRCLVCKPLPKTWDRSLGGKAV